MLRYQLLFLSFGLLCLACQKEEWEPQPHLQNKDTLIHFQKQQTNNFTCMLPPEEMPYLTVCAHLTTKWERKRCSDQKIFDLINDNIKYPKDAGCFNGIVVVSFTINEYGSKDNIKIVRGGPLVINQEALRLINMLPAFMPGKFMGKITKAQYNFPIRFHAE